MDRYLRNFLGLFYGIVYGVAHIVPGLSGGTFLVIFGCYDIVCEAFALNFKTIKNNFLFFVCFGIGTIGGLVGFAHIIIFLLESFVIQTNLFFMGLILGGLPLIAKIAEREEKFKPLCIFPFAIGLALVVSLFFFERLGMFGGAAAQSNDAMFFAKIVIYAFVAAVAMVMPGISGAFVLVVFGVYDMFMDAVRVLDFTLIVPAAIGVLLGIVVGAKLVLLLLKKFELMIYSAIIGMVIGSIVPLFPYGFGINIATFIGLVTLVLGALAAHVMGGKEAGA